MYKKENLKCKKHKHFGYQTCALIISRTLITVFIIFNSVQDANAQIIDSINFYSQQYNYEKVIKLISKLDQNSLNQDLLYLKSIALKGLNKYQEAIPILKEIYQADSTNLNVICELAECNKSINNFKEAQQLYQKAILLNPENKYLIQQLANSYYSDDNFIQAIKFYLTAISADTTYYLTRQLAKCYDNLEMSDTAILFYKKAISFNPKDGQSIYRLSTIFKNLENYNEAINYTDSYLKINTNNLKILKLSGYLHYLNKDYNIAAKKFKYCLQLNDTTIFVNKYLGYSLFKLEQYGEAKDYLEYACLKDSSNADLCYVLALSCSHSYYKNQAIEYFNKTLDLLTPKPELLSQVYQDLAIANDEYSRFQEALNAYLKAYELTPNDTLLIFKIGSYYDNRLEDKEKALKYYNEFMLSRPKKIKPVSEKSRQGGMVISYYDFVEKRINEIKEEIFWTGEKNKTSN